MGPTVGIAYGGAAIGLPALVLVGTPLLAGFVIAAIIFGDDD